MKRATAYLIFVAVFLAASPAWAIAPPLTPVELLAESDLVALVRVLSVTCTGLYYPFWPDLAEVLAYVAQLEILSIRKGSVRPGEIIAVKWEKLSDELALETTWTVAYHPGEQVWTHLQRVAHKDGLWLKHSSAYVNTWWNARDQTLREAESYDLPRLPGETVQ
jgi:hypothetical protein